MRDLVGEHEQTLRWRTMVVRKARVLPVEAIVRGYITGLQSLVAGD